MKVYHQIGFRHNWNIESFNDGNGEGLILSPVNMESDKLLALPENIRSHSFLDPQMYLLGTEKASNVSYPFFPGNIKAGFSTADLDVATEVIAKECIDYQVQAGLKYVVIPTRYLEMPPTKYLEQMTRGFVVPFLDYKAKNSIEKPFLLTVVVRQSVLVDEASRDEMLNWMTGIQDIAGFYLIFDNNFPTKQIRDFDYLRNALFFIDILKRNQFEVHIGYANTEGLLYSAAMPDSVSMGSYENLRNFRISRFEVAEKNKMRSPNARLYSSKLLQWIEYNYIQSMRQMIPEYEDLFDATQYRPLMFTPTYQWHFSKPELYKHYFEVFNHQIISLPADQKERVDNLLAQIIEANERFRHIKESILLDDDSGDAHLPIWYNVLNDFKRQI